MGANVPIAVGRDSPLYGDELWYLHTVTMERIQVIYS